MLLNQHSTNAISLLQSPSNRKANGSASDNSVREVSLTGCGAGEATRGLPKRFCAAARKHSERLIPSQSLWVARRFGDKSNRKYFHESGGRASRGLLMLCRPETARLTIVEESDVFQPDD